LGIVKVSERYEDDTIKECSIDKFPLSGIIKSGSTYLIRAKQHLDLNSPLTYVPVDSFD
jgi:hypothetical protein